MLDFLKKWTVWKIDDNPKMSAFLALIAGWLEAKLNGVWTAIKFVVQLVS